jgi:hypothetical protein
MVMSKHTRAHDAGVADVGPCSFFCVRKRMQSGHLQLLGAGLPLKRSIT